MNLTVRLKEKPRECGRMCAGYGHRSLICNLRQLPNYAHAPLCGRLQI